MISILQHIPNFVEGIEPQKITVANTAELLVIPFIKRWSEDPRFYRFSISKRQRSDVRSDLLMAELDKNKEWWVVGYLTGDVDLPEHKNQQEK